MEAFLQSAVAIIAMAAVSKLVFAFLDWHDRVYENLVRSEMRRWRVRRLMRESGRWYRVDGGVTQVVAVGEAE